MAGAFVRLLGAVRFVDEDGEAIDLPSAAQRRLLAALALANGAPLRSDYLCDALDLTNGSLRTTVSRVRSRIGDGVIRTDSDGYRITCAVDATLFTDLLADDPEGTDRLAALDGSLALWHGEALDEFRHEAWAAPAVARLDELRALAVEDRAELLIARGRADEAVAALEPHIAAHPLRDRPRGLLIQALASSGRQADALRAYQDYRGFLAEETGTEPSAVVRSIERRAAAWDEADGNDGLDRVRQRPAPRGGPRVVELPLPGELAEAPELIGRQREVAWLESDLLDVRSGSLKIALIGGEAGIGKTTMLAAFARAHRDAGQVVAFGRCADGEAVPLEPFRGIVAGLVEHVPPDLLHEHAERCGGELQRIAPRLGHRLWVPPPVERDAASERHLLFEAVTDLLRRVASSGSLTLILDDLHWAEPTALQLLRHLSRSLVDAPVLLVASYRDSPADSAPELRTALADLGRGRCRTISLGGFDDTELGWLAEHAVGVCAQPATDVLAHLRDETSGNPLFAVQLVRHLWETKQLTVADEELSFAGGAAAQHLPRGLRDVVWSRVHALGDRTTDVLSAASVLGTEFAPEVLAQTTGLDEHDVDARLDSAIGAGLLVETDDARRPLRFVHALVAHALYSELPPRHRRRLHGRATHVLRRGGAAPSPDVVIELARHAFLSGDLTAAQEWAVLAGDHAYANLAPAEAARWYERALEYAAERQVDEAERAELETRLGEALHRAGDPRARQTLLAAAASARRVGAREALVRAALANDRGFSSPRLPDVEQLEVLDAAIAAGDPDDLSTMARLLALRAQELVHTSEHELRLESARQAIELLDRSDDPRLLPQMISALAFGLWGPATIELRRELAARAAAATGRIKDPILEFTARRATFYVGVESADPELAATSLERVKAIAAEIGEPRLRWICAALEAFEATMEARLDDAEQHSTRMLEIGTEIGEPDAFALYAAQLFVNRSFAGRYAEVIPLLEAALETAPDAIAYRAAHAISCSVSGREDDALAFLLEGLASGFDRIPIDWTWITTVIGYAVLAIELEHREAADALYPIIEPYAEQVSFNGGTSQGFIGAYVGKLASLLGEHDVADVHLRRALEVHSRFGWKYHEATTLVALASSRHRWTGTLDAQGRAWLDDARAIAEERGLAIVTKQVEQLRRSLGDDTRV